MQQYAMIKSCVKLTAGPSIIIVQSIQLEHNSLLVIYKKKQIVFSPRQ